jgi:caspase 8
MVSSPHGLCVIAHWVYFDHSISLKPRLGSEIDVKRLTDTFTLMGYDVRTPYVDLTKDEFFALLKSIHEADHSLCDSFILCILSHGDEDLLFTYDDAIEVDLIYEPIRTCTTLLGKPKIFIHQCCRGDRTDKGVKIPSLKESESKLQSLPTNADCVYLFATSPKHKAWRSSKSGSYYIYCLCEAIVQYNGSEDLGNILLTVNAAVAENFWSHSQTAARAGVRQQPGHEVYLRGKLFWNSSNLTAVKKA